MQISPNYTLINLSPLNLERQVYLNFELYPTLFTPHCTQKNPLDSTQKINLLEIVVNYLNNTA